MDGVLEYYLLESYWKHDVTKMKQNKHMNQNIIASLFLSLFCMLLPSVLFLRLSRGRLACLCHSVSFCVPPSSYTICYPWERRTSIRWLIHTLHGIPSFFFFFFSYLVMNEWCFGIKCLTSDGALWCKLWIRCLIKIYSVSTTPIPPSTTKQGVDRPIEDISNYLRCIISGMGPIDGGK